VGDFTAFNAWFHQYGYNADPLSIKPSTKLIGREREIKILSENLVSGNIALLWGDAGLGKTSILRSIEVNFSKDKEFKVHYISMLGGFNKIKQFCVPPSWFESILLNLGLKKKKKQCFLVDEAQLMLFNQAETLRHLFDCEDVHSLIIAGGEKNNLNLSLSFKRRVGENLLISKLSLSELKELLKLRLNGVNPLLEETVDYLAKVSDGNPREFLINCKKVCIKVHEFFNTEKSIDLLHAKEIVVKKTNNGFFEKEVERKDNALENLTPLQKAILEQLNHNPMSLNELSQAVGSSIGTIGKQISVLSLKTKREYMSRKGVTEPLIKKDKDSAITMYHLTENTKKMLGGS